MKDHPQCIRARFQQRFHRDAPAPEHIVAMKDGLVVHVNVCVGVQPFKNQVNVLVRNRCGVGLESGPVFPVGQSDPLESGVVILVERIGNQTIA
jgi:hypothetical protein